MTTLWLLLISSVVIGVYPTHKECDAALTSLVVGNLIDYQSASCEYYQDGANDLTDLLVPTHKTRKVKTVRIPAP